MKDKDYNEEPFEDSSAIWISTGQETDFSLIQGILQASELANETNLNFEKGRLIEGEKSSLYQSQILKRVSKREKFEKKIISFLKEYKQAFDVIAAKPTDLHEAFLCPNTSLALRIASPDVSLCQSDKVEFRNYIMKSSISASSFFPRLQNGSLMKQQQCVL